MFALDPDRAMLRRFPVATAPMSVRGNVGGGDDEGEERARMLVVRTEAHTSAASVDVRHCEQMCRVLCPERWCVASVF